MADENKENPTEEQPVCPVSTVVVEKRSGQTEEEVEVKKMKIIASGAVQAENLFIGCKNIHIDNSQMPAQPLTSRKEATLRNEHIALQRLRKVLKNSHIRVCQVDVTDGYNDLAEPINEVNPKVLKLLGLKFYEGDLLEKITQYQKDQALKCGTEFISSSEELNYDTFLNHIVETETKRIAIIGQAGSGKSTMLTRLVRDLPTKLDVDYLIFFKNFRDFNDLKEMTPCELLLDGLLPADTDVCYEWIQENQDKVVLVFDGLDQASWSVDEKSRLIEPYSKGKVSEIMSNIFKKNLFPDVKVLYSSREYAVASLQDKLRPETVVSLIGFSPADSEMLFKSLIGKDGDMLWEKLRQQSHSLIPLLSIPMFLIFTAIAHKLNPDTPPRFMTEILLNLLRHYECSRHNTQTTEEEMLKVMIGLKEMSFLGIRDGRVVFHHYHFQTVGLNPEEVCNWIIRMPGTNIPNQRMLEGMYRFLFSHQIIQEFLAAQYIIESSFKFFKEVVTQYLVLDNWSVVTRFVSGLLLNDEISADLDKIDDVERKRRVFKNMLVEKYRERGQPSLELLAIISESNNGLFIKDLVHYISICYTDLSDSDAYIIASVMRHLGCFYNLSFETCSLSSGTFQILWDNIEHCSLEIFRLDIRNVRFDSNAFVTIGKLVKKCSIKELNIVACNVTTQALEEILSACEGSVILKLDISYSRFDDKGFATLGKLVKTCAVDQLKLESSDLNDGKLKILLSEIEGEKISMLDISYTNLEDISYATPGKFVKMCAVDKLRLEACDFSAGTLQKFLAETVGRKISTLDVTSNNMDEVKATILGDIVKQCSVEDLTMCDCELNDVSLKALLSRASGSKISKLDVSDNKLDDVGCATLGKIVKMCTVNELKLEQCYLSEKKLKNFLSETEGTKISKLDISGDYSEDLDYAIVGKIVKMCAVDELRLTLCDLNHGKLMNLLSETKGSKIHRLDISFNHLNEETVAVLGDIVKQCSVEKLIMHECGLWDHTLKILLSRASGAKLSFLDVSKEQVADEGVENYISQVFLGKIRSIMNVRA